MARHPVPGDAKTRLIQPGLTTPVDAAVLAWSMLSCTVERLRAHHEVILAVTPDDASGSVLARLGSPRIRCIGQGDSLPQSGHLRPRQASGEGDLGERMIHVWQMLGPNQPLAFIGMDSPDVPDDALSLIEPALSTHDMAIGPTRDGGYWTLAASRLDPQLFRGIDWGTERVYDQTCRRAANAGLRVNQLPTWDDVDRLEDVHALRLRLNTRIAAATSAEVAAPAEPTTDAFRRLAASIDEVLGSVRMPQHR